MLVEYFVNKEETIKSGTLEAEEADVLAEALVLMSHVFVNKHTGNIFKYYCFNDDNQDLQLFFHQLHQDFRNEDELVDIETREMSAYDFLAEQMSELNNGQEDDDDNTADFMLYKENAVDTDGEIISALLNVDVGAYYIVGLCMDEESKIAFYYTLYGVLYATCHMLKDFDTLADAFLKCIDDVYTGIGVVQVATLETEQLKSFVRNYFEGPSLNAILWRNAKEKWLEEDDNEE